MAERIVIECGIYEKLKLSEIAKKIGKLPESVSREIRANRTLVPGQHYYEKIAAFPESIKQKVYAKRKDVTRGVCPAVNTYAEIFVQDTTTHHALSFRNLHMFAMFVCGVESVKQTEHTT